MNALSPIRPHARHLHAAARAFAYPILDGSLTYSAAVSALVRTALREGLLDDDGALETLPAQLEDTLNATIAEISADAVATVRRIILLCLSRNAVPVIVREAALATNAALGEPLPITCVDFLVKQETRRNKRASARRQRHGR